MPYARTQAYLDIQRREPNGRKQRQTTQEGRQRATEVREHETEAQTLAAVLSQREGFKALSGREDAKLGKRDPKYGYALGRLFLTGALSLEQLGAGTRYVELYLRHGYHVTGSLPRFPSTAVNDAASGITCVAGLDDDAVSALKRSWHEAQTALADTGEWVDCSSALVAVGVMDREPRSEAQLGALRVGLNALHRVWG